MGNELLKLADSKNAEMDGIISEGEKLKKYNLNIKRNLSHLRPSNQENLLPEKPKLLLRPI